MKFCSQCHIIQDIEVINKHITIIMPDNIKVVLRANKTVCIKGHDLATQEEKKHIIRVAKRKHKLIKFKNRVVKISDRLFNRRK